MNRLRGVDPRQLSDLAVTAAVAAALLGGSLFTALGGADPGPPSGRPGVRGPAACAPAAGRCPSADPVHRRLTREPRTGLCLG